MSLRELLIAVSLLALAMASLNYANDAWLALVAGVAMLAFLGSAIIAVVDRGPRQAMAIGFSLTMLAYGLILTTGQETSGRRGNVSSTNIEMDPWEGRLPTTRLLRYLHIAVSEEQEITLGAPGFPMRKGIMEVPRREVFTPIGHCWWAIILGYAGGRFARFVYTRRIQENGDR